MMAIFVNSVDCFTSATWVFLCFLYRLLATMMIYVNDVPSSTLSEDKTPVKWVYTHPFLTCTLFHWVTFHLPSLSNISCVIDIDWPSIHSVVLTLCMPRLSVLQELFGKALEAINMDLVFLEDSEHSFLPEATSMSALEHHTFYHNTTSYIFTWLLIIKAMGQCDPEVHVHVHVHV